MSHSTSSASSALQFRGERALDFQPSPALFLSSHTHNGTGRENGGWMVERCPVQFLLNLSTSSTSLYSHTPVFPLYHSFSNSYFLPLIDFFPTLHCTLCICHLSIALGLQNSKPVGSMIETYSPCFSTPSLFSVPRRGHVR